MTERDGLVLDFINRYKLCTKDHIYNIYFNQVHTTVCSRRLKYLNDYGYIKREKFNGNNYIYYSGTKPNNKLIPHDLLITDVVVKFLSEGYEILDFKKSFVLGDIISDAYIQVKKDNKVKNVLLEVQLSGHDCLSKYKNIKKLVIDNTHWDVLPRLLVVGDVSQIYIKGLIIHYLSSKLDESINI